MDNKIIKEVHQDIQVKNINELELLKTIKPNSIDLILVDPPYITSRKLGMDEMYKNAKM